MNPSALIVDAEGILIVGEQLGGITRFGPEGNILSQNSLAAVDGAYAELFALAPGRDGALYMSDPYSNRLILLDPAGSSYELLGKAQLSRPFQLAVDSQGDIYVVEYGNDRVQKFHLIEN